MGLPMRLFQTARGRFCVLISFIALAPLLEGCGSPAVETPAEIPPAPIESSKASFEALSGKKATPKPVPPK
jgi:hypothetical protein